MRNKTIFVACDTSNLGKIKKIIYQAKKAMDYFEEESDVQGKCSPGSFFLKGATSECAKILFLLILYFFFIFN